MFSTQLIQWAQYKAILAGLSGKMPANNQCSSCSSSLYYTNQYIQ